MARYLLFAIISIATVTILFPVSEGSRICLKKCRSWCHSSNQGQTCDDMCQATAKHCIFCSVGRRCRKCESGYYLVKTTAGKRCYSRGKVLPPSTPPSPPPPPPPPPSTTEAATKNETTELNDVVQVTTAGEPMKTTEPNDVVEDTTAGEPMKTTVPIIEEATTEDPRCPHGFTFVYPTSPFGGGACFIAKTTSTDRSTAVQECADSLNIANKPQLVIIDSYTKYMGLAPFLTQVSAQSTCTTAWIAACATAQWMWAPTDCTNSGAGPNSTPVGFYKNWNVQPDGSAYCVTVDLNQNALWNTHDCTEKACFICETAKLI